MKRKALPYVTFHMYSDTELSRMSVEQLERLLATIKLRTSHYRVRVMAQLEAKKQK